MLLFHHKYLLFICIALSHVCSIDPTVSGALPHCRDRCSTGHGGLPAAESSSTTHQEASPAIGVLPTRRGRLSIPDLQIPSALQWPHPHSASGRRVLYGRSRFWDFASWRNRDPPSNFWRAPIIIADLGEVAVLQVEVRSLLITPTIRVMIWNTDAPLLASRYMEAFGRVLNRITIIAGLFQVSRSHAGGITHLNRPRLIRPDRVFTQRGTLPRILPNLQGRSAPWITWTFLADEGDLDDDLEPGLRGHRRLPGYGDPSQIRNGHTWGTHRGRWPTHESVHAHEGDSHAVPARGGELSHSQETYQRNYVISSLQDNAVSVLLFQWTITIDDEPS